jgi:effector-binding domain-containing protein
MTRFIEFLISLLIVAVLFVLIGVFLPAKRSFSFSTETNRPMATVNDLLNNFSRFKDWNPLLRYDPKMQTSTSGPAEGVGAKFNYESRDKVIGKGSWEIVESVPGKMIKYRLVNPSSGDNKFMTFKFERATGRNKNIKITQQYSVEYGWNLFSRYAGLYVTRNVGDDIKRGLDKLTSFLATIPKFDYSTNTAGYSIVEQPAQDVLLVTTAAHRSNDEIATAMTNQISWINKVMAANGLVAAGPLRIVTNEFTSDSYGFDVVMPVRKADVAEGTPAGERLNITLEGPVTYDQLPARRTAMTSYTGPAPALPQIRDQLRAWAMVHGADIQDRPYEEYLGGVSTMLNDDAQFKVYWPLK